MSERDVWTQKSETVRIRHSPLDIHLTKHLKFQAVWVKDSTRRALGGPLEGTPKSQYHIYVIHSPYILSIYLASAYKTPHKLQGSLLRVPPKAPRSTETGLLPPLDPGFGGTVDVDGSDPKYPNLEH